MRPTHLWPLAGTMLAMLLCLTAAGCGNSSQPNAQGTLPNPGTDVVPAKAFDLTVTSPVADTLSGAATTAIAATVFVPQHVKGATYPLIVHSHGWGGNRITESDASTNNQNADTSTLYSRIVDLQVKWFWDHGYAVVSFDERGIGQSGGAVRVMDPEYETRDAIAILDWAEQNLDLKRDAGGDPYVGTIGGSYGGGFQLLLAAVDHRVDAITPSATWYNLNLALQDNKVLKKGWLTGLCLVAKTDQRRMDPTVQAACEEGADDPATRFTEDLLVSGPGITDYFDQHSLSAFEAKHDDPASGYRMKPVSALLVQGMRDTLFTLNHAYYNFRFLKRLGGDVRLITHQHGHILPAPFSQNAKLGSIACGAQDTIEAIRAWMDDKLRGNGAATANIPDVCISLDDSHGVNLSAVPVGGSSVVTIPATAVTSANSNMSSGSGPVFIPLSAPVAGNNLVLAGIPTASLQVTPAIPTQKAVAFVGVGIKKADGSGPFLVDYQVRPLRSDLDHTHTDLYGAGAKLENGDTVGILIYGDFDEMEPAGRPVNFAGNSFTISGSVNLPVFAPAGN